MTVRDLIKELKTIPQDLEVEKTSMSVVGHYYIVYLLDWMRLQQKMGVNIDDP